jgi:hypothetical protein
MPHPSGIEIPTSAELRDNLRAQNVKLREWCQWMIEGLQHLAESEDRDVKYHALGTLTDEKTGRAIPALFAEMVGTPGGEGEAVGEDFPP